MKIIYTLPGMALALVFALLIPNSALAISDYQSGYDDGYAAAQVSNANYAIGDACQNQSTQYCNGFIVGYTTEFFALYQNLPTTVVVHEGGPNVVVIHPHQYYNPHPPFIVVHRQFYRYPNSHVYIGPPSHHSTVIIHPHFGQGGPGPGFSHDNGGSGSEQGPGFSHDNGGSGSGQGSEGHHNH